MALGDLGWDEKQRPRATARMAWAVRAMRNPDNIDHFGFRPNVCIVIQNDRGQVLWARRIGGFDAWQFPQGGIHRGETVEQALYRELHEEVGLAEASVEVLARTQGWLRYRLPANLTRDPKTRFIGQKQKWFLLRLLVDDESIDTGRTDKPEFDCWRWVSYWYPVGNVVSFKRAVYRRALKELAPALRVA